MADAFDMLREQLAAQLADTEKHRPILDAVLEIVRESGGAGLKKQIQQWIEDVKAREKV